MPEPPFFLQIADATGAVIRTRAGGKHEADLIEHFVAAIMPKIGFFKTEKTIEAAVRAGISDALYDLKVKNPYDVING